MKKILNPYTNSESRNCFGCSHTNPLGLQMEFFEDGKYVTSIWEPKEHLTGYGNVIHGGIQSTLLDEIASWVVYIKVKTTGVTASLNVKFRNAVFADKGNLTIRAKLVKQSKRFATIHAELLDNNGKLCSEAEISYFIFPLEIAMKKYQYPGAEAFFEQ